jgi:hypothetical protein
MTDTLKKQKSLIQISNTTDPSINSEMSTKKTTTTTSNNDNDTNNTNTNTNDTNTNTNDTNFSEYELKKEYDKINCDDINFYSNECNKFLLKKEVIESNYLSEHPEENSYLYPNLNDKEFNIKISNKKEFNDTKYDGKIHEDIKEYADILSKADFELQPHQIFVKNFLSFQTPYSSLLLYHGLGSGKTCSAIGVCEEMRDYMKQIGTTKRIIIVASENVQDNFKLQLFDERKLKLVDGLWNIRACTGNKLLKEINPMNMKGMSKEKVVSQIKNLINTYYIFLGYGQFANYIIKTMHYDEEVQKQDLKRFKGEKGEISKKNKEKSKIQMLKDIKIELNSRIIRRLRNEFDNRLIVIDEVHNIRKTDDNENKKVAVNLELLVKSAQNMRFLLLSATPMYNSYKEIVWLLNLMNTNDRRGRIEVRDIFDKTGNFKKNGEELLIRKATGYISFVRGENPYTFPYRVYPNEFASQNTFPTIKYPLYQMNLKKIKHEDKKRILSLYLNELKDCKNCGKCQYCAYKYIIYNLRNRSFSITTKTGIVRDMPDFENMESFGYTLLQTPLEALIISYPVNGLKNILDEMPDEVFSEELSPSFSESISNDDYEINDILYQSSDEEEKPTLIEEEEPTLIEEEEPTLIDEEEPTLIEEEEPTLIEEESITKMESIKSKRCPNGRHRNPKTKECDPIKKKNLILESTSSKEISASKELSPDKISTETLHELSTSKEISPDKITTETEESNKLSKEISPDKITTETEESNKLSKEISPDKITTETLEEELQPSKELSPDKITTETMESNKLSTSKEISPDKITTETMESNKLSKEVSPDKITTETMESNVLSSSKEISPDKITTETEESNKLSKEISPDKITTETMDQDNVSTIIMDEEKQKEMDNIVKNITRCPNGRHKNPKTKICEPIKKIGGSHNAIDPHQLTGKVGLERMMNFVDEKSPPIKGEFEYKKTTIEKYGRIFSKELIGNYSIKIKTILNNIYNSETNKVSDGVILIYSQYIDSGLIPMALALEEMGFTRYGQQGIKPLFKNKPTEIVDVRTMQPPIDKKDFMPARYSMITGETRLSPNNDYEVKGLINEDNKDGNKIKVVLISKAGSEGIDFQFIRQVHILEPWYNMNRVEQIIGRAVRNFSHKDLPFEKRNVEIFMYGTILGDNKEEAADLYVYRVAEYKAIQIGKVTRVLKETAVDCIINHDQTNFTQDKLSYNLKEPIQQILSNGLVLNNFKIGDAPFSPACDYMAECDYKCRPDMDIDEDNLNEDTYNEKFIIMNSEKITQRIRMLMKESFFYKKDVLIKSIRTPKEYPYVQIYSALTQLIEDENEFITDKYGRNGRLVNIGDYYIFQPIELRDKNASLFDRSVPIDYKHSMINFEIKKQIAKPLHDNRSVNLINESNVSFTKGKNIVDEMKINFDITREFTKQKKVPRGDDNWYKHCGIVIQKMTKEFPESKEYLISFLVAHILDILLFDDKLETINYLYSLDNIRQGSFEWFAKEYFETNSVTSKKFTVYIMYKLNKRKIMILGENNKWIEAEPEDQREIASSKETKEYLSFNLENYNKIVGFIGYEKGNRYLVFKTKDMLSKRDIGARCDESGKIKTLQKINEILGENKYTKENTKMIKDADGNVISEAVGQIELCVLQEFILRYFNTIKREDKNWFLTPEMAIWHKLYTIFV